MKRLRRAIAVILLLALVLVLLVYFSASSWLESSAGRNLLQRELGKILGLDADLQGEYSLELFPGLQIKGQHLELREIDASQAVARLGSYQLHLALWPLLKKQVLIHKVEVHEGFLDLDLLQSDESAKPENAQSESELPRIRSLQFSELKLRKSGAELLTVNQLLLENFAPGRDTAITLAFSPPGTGAQPGMGMVQLRGSMQLHSTPLQLSLNLAELTVRMGEQVWIQGPGELSWSSASGTVDGSLKGQLAGYSSQFDFTLQTTPAMSIDLSVKLLADDGRGLSGTVSARDEAGLWVLEPVEMLLGAQALAGSGCFSLEPKPRLQLKLQSSVLDLDTLKVLIPDDWLTTGPEPSTVDPDLPVDFAVELVVKQATMAGVVAREVRLLLGGEPNCGS